MAPGLRADLRALVNIAERMRRILDRERESISRLLGRL